jgi:phosphonate transport system permease protein
VIPAAAQASVPAAARAGSLQERAARLSAARLKGKTGRYLIYLGVFGLVVWSVHGTIVVDTDWERIGGLSAIARSVGRFAAVDFELVPHLLGPTLETFMVACLGTLLGMCMSVPVAWLGARNIAPFAPIAYPIARALMTISRSVHEIVWALIFVSAVGLGALPGILALALRSIGFISKMTAEAIEDVDPKVIEAIRAVGGNRFQIVLYGILPQILPVFLGTIIFEWDINIRRSAIMGLVGAGGLGLAFHRQMVMYNYPGVTTVILAILSLIVIGEVVSYYGRKAVI